MRGEYPIVDYRSVRLHNLTSDRFRHLFLLIFWPLYGLAFHFVEHIYPVKHYFPVYSPLDDMIPFNEYFVIPYLFWFLFLFGMVVYTVFYDVDGFRRMMKFIILTYTFTIVLYLFFPTCQELRPTVFERDNLFVRAVQAFYAQDTNTNVCPSIHVIGSWAGVFAGWHTKRFKTPLWRAAFVLVGVLISLSTVFMKQHSIIDVFAAIPVCVVGYLLCYVVRKKEVTA